MHPGRRRFLRFGALSLGVTLIGWTLPVLGPSSALAQSPEMAAAIARDPRLGHTWRCLGSECPGYTYDPMVGESEWETPPLTAFEDLPDDWACPRCGAGKIEFLRQAA